MEKKIFARSHREPLALTPLIQVPMSSYQWFWEEGLKELLDEISPVKDFSGKDLELWFVDFKLGEPRFNEYEARLHNASYESPLRVKVRLVNKRTREAKEQEVFLGDFPLMTERGTFIVNGVERVVISQLIRSPGVFFTMVQQRGRKLFGAKVIPNRGAWLEFETDYAGVLWVKVDRKRKAPASSLLRAFGLAQEEEIRKKFEDLSKSDELHSIEETLKRDTSKDQGEGLLEIYKRVRPGDLATVENARQLIESMFFNFDRYDLSRVGRWKMDLRLRGEGRKKMERADRVLAAEDIVMMLREIIRLNNDPLSRPDEIDHLGNRRVRALGELFQGRLRVGMARMERIIKDRMSTLDIYTLTPIQLINARPLTAIVKEFFTSSQLSQFMDNENPLAELEHKRRLSAMGPGGLTRERAGFDVRDVQPSHYGRICPIQTPEGPNIGLVGHLAVYARLNPFGFIETPYFKVKKGRVTSEVVYLDATQEERYAIAHAGVATDAQRHIRGERVEARVRGEPTRVDKDKVDFIDVAPQQLVSIATALIPFLEHDDANRAMMGSNMQRQSVPCVQPEAPLVGTGFEERAAKDSGQVVLAREDGIVTKVDAKEIVVTAMDKNRKGGLQHRYALRTFLRSNQYTCITQRPQVHKGEKVRAGSLLADGAAIDQGELALGQNLLVAFLPWRGANYEDAIVISERVVWEDRFTSIHIEDFVCDVRETKLGPEITTPDIPNVGEDKLKDLDEDGIVRIGAEVRPGDILVGKISPKGEADLTPEERLLRAIFGEKAHDVKDTSLRLPHGKRGRVVGIRIFTRDRGDKLPPGVIKSIQVEIAQLRRISAGDKLAGRHGNKGVISKILPMEEMPFLADGTPVDIVLNPLGIVSRMNIGQILETHLGFAAKKLGYRVVTPALSGATEEDIRRELEQAGLPSGGQVALYDGHSGDPFPQKVTVGYLYIMKLIHMVEDKIHMRSIGPYSLITQQPLGGKAQFGGQRFGEMEVWALEGYGASHTLQEMLTIKSDDVIGRSQSYESIIRGESIRSPNIPASFHVLLNELRALGLGVDLLGMRSRGEEKQTQQERWGAAVDGDLKLADKAPEAQ